MWRRIGKLEPFTKKHSGVGTGPKDSLFLASRKPEPVMDRKLTSIEEGAEQ